MALPARLPVRASPGRPEASQMALTDQLTLVVHFIYQRLKPHFTPFTEPSARGEVVVEVVEKKKKKHVPQRRYKSHLVEQL